MVAYAFDNNAPHDVGPVKVLKVAAAQDLQIAALSGEAGDGALTLLGEPDIWCEPAGDGLVRMAITGYDTYDPATLRVRPSPGDDVDCWMVDTDHDGTAFFPRLVYLPAHKRRDPAVRDLLKSLGRDLDPDAEKALCGLESQPFRPPEPPRRIAVKIITRTGAEMTSTVDPPS